MQPILFIKGEKYYSNDIIKYFSCVRTKWSSRRTTDFTDVKDEAVQIRVEQRKETS